MSDDWSLEQIEEYKKEVWNAAIEAAAELMEGSEYSQRIIRELKK